MLLPDLFFASFLTYAPRGNTKDIINSQKWMRLLKFDQIVGEPRRLMSRYVADMLVSQIARTPFQHFFGPEVTLVPVPKSSLLPRDGLWVPQRIASAMVDVGLGSGVATVLERTRPIRKTAFCAPEDRPKASDHYDTLRAIAPLEPLRRIVLVDDVITRGAVLLGAASRVTEACPKAEIRGFAMIRTISDPKNFIAIGDPCVGEIRRRGEETYRKP